VKGPRFYTRVGVDAGWMGGVSLEKWREKNWRYLLDRGKSMKNALYLIELGKSDFDQKRGPRNQKLILYIFFYIEKSLLILSLYIQLYFNSFYLVYICGLFEAVWGLYVEKTTTMLMADFLTNLSTFSTDSACQLDVLGHNGNTSGMNSGQVSV
jgi:hypothetical protein